MKKRRKVKSSLVPLRPELPGQTEMLGFTLRETFDLVCPETCWGELPQSAITRTDSLFGGDIDELMQQRNEQKVLH